MSNPEYLVMPRVGLLARLLGKAFPCDDTDTKQKCVLPMWHPAYHCNEFGESWSYGSMGEVVGSWTGEKIPHVRRLPISWRRCSPYRSDLFFGRWEAAIIDSEGYASYVCIRSTKRQAIKEALEMSKRSW